MANPTTNYGFVLPTPTDLVTDLPADFDVALQGVDTQLKALQPGTTLGDLAYSSATANTNTRLGIGTAGQVLAVSGGVPAWTTTADVTPLTTKGDLFTFTTVDARIGVGANETRLVSDSAEATGLKYVADTTNYVIAAKADLLVGTAADTVAALTVGTNGQVLTADSTVSPTGLKWATPASGATFAGCSLYKSATQNLTNNAGTTLTFNTELFDVGDYHEGVTNPSRITIPAGKAGYYEINAKVSFSANATGIRVVYIYLNGANINNAARSKVSADENEAVLNTQIYNCAVADYFEIIVYQNSGGVLTATNTATETTFSITYLGA